MSTISTHILDIAKGQPAVGVAVQVFHLVSDSWEKLGSGTTDKNGRVLDLLEDGTELQKGTYKMRFDVAEYASRESKPSFYPEIDIAFSIENSAEHYHIPLLLSPFGYSTYRGG